MKNLKNHIITNNIISILISVLFTYLYILMSIDNYYNYSYLIRDIIIIMSEIYIISYSIIAFNYFKKEEKGCLWIHSFKKNYITTTKEGKTLLNRTVFFGRTIWIFLIANITVFFVELINSEISNSFIPRIISFIFFVYWLNISIYRLDDTNKSNWNILWGILRITIPILFYKLSLPSVKRK